MHGAQRSHSHLAVHRVKDHIDGVQQHLAGGHGGGEADLVIQLSLQLRHQLNGGEVRQVHAEHDAYSVEPCFSHTSSRLTPAAGHDLLDPPTHLQHAGLLQEAIQSLGHDDGGEAGPELLQGGEYAVEGLKGPGLWGARCKGLPVDRVGDGGQGAGLQQHLGVGGPADRPPKRQNPVQKRRPVIF